ncbi:MAG: hypothetical protein ACRDQI_01400 [Pseudonocardiaceae bacterium]
MTRSRWTGLTWQSSLSGVRAAGTQRCRQDHHDPHDHDGAELGPDFGILILASMVMISIVSTLLGRLAR